MSGGGVEGVSGGVQGGPGRVRGVQNFWAEKQKNALELYGEPAAQQHPGFCAGGSSRPNGSGTPFRCLPWPPLLLPQPPTPRRQEGERGRLNLPSVQHATQGSADMYINTYTCMHIYAYTYIYIYTYLCISVCMHVRTYVRTLSLFFVAPLLFEQQGVLALDQH